MLKLVAFYVAIFVKYIKRIHTFLKMVNLVIHIL